MYKLALLFSVFFVLNATAKINNDSNSLCLDLDYIDLIKKEYELEKSLFEKVEDSNFENFD
ncbi:MAG: hypothetical protein KAJ28_07835, partial [Flavobacteriaceae bacterium]|nr:hypothetical protein [Flavobacteriaceae bacterium]